MTFTSQESLLVDYAKALGIALVVLGHYDATVLDVYPPYVYHMPLFFLIGGITMKPVASWRAWLGKLRRDVLYIAIWYVVLAVCALALNAGTGTQIGARLGDGSWHGWVTWPIRRNMHNNALFLVAWFLVAYLLASNAFRLLLTLAPRWLESRGRASALLVGLPIGFLAVAVLAPYHHEGAKSWTTNLACQVGVGFLFVSIGFALRPRLGIVHSVGLFAVTAFAMYALVRGGWVHPVIMSWSRYPDPFPLFLLGALLGSHGVLHVAHLLSLSGEHRWLRECGRRSKDVMALHLLGLVLVDRAVAALGWKPVERVTARAFYSAEPFLLPVAMTVGLALPLAVRAGLDRVRALVGRRFARTEP